MLVCASEDIRSETKVIARFHAVYVCTGLYCVWMCIHVCALLCYIYLKGSNSEFVNLNVKASGNYNSHNLKF